MATPDLWWPAWNGLAQARQQFLIQQLSRYFLSPLLTVDAQVPVTVTYFGQTLRTFDVLVGGEWLRFVPGQAAVTLGAPQPLPPAWQSLLSGVTLSPQTAVTMPPMLVARAAVPSDLQVIGRVDLTTQRFTGDHFAYVPIKAAVVALLTRSADPLNPVDAWPATLTAGHVVLRRQSAHHYQVTVRQNWTQPVLVQALSSKGYALPTERQYEYLMSGGLQQATPWGNQLPPVLARYQPNRFGLTVPVARTGAELTQGEWGKSRALTPPVTAADRAALSPWYRTRPGSFADAAYRKVAVISLD